MRNKKILMFLLISIFFVAVAASVISAQEKPAVIFSGSTIGGVTNLQASGLAAVGKQYCEIEPTVVVNPTLAQIDVMADGDADICTSYGYEAWFAYYGEDRWEGKPYSGLRSMMSRPNATVQFAVPAKSDIQSVYDFEGKRVNLGRKGFGSELQGRTILEALGINYTPVNLGHSDAVAAIAAGNCDVYLNSGAFPHPSFIEMSETMPGGIRIIGFSEEEVAKILEASPFFTTTKMGPEYKGMPDGEITVPQVESMILCRDVVPEEIMYCLVKNFWDHQDFAAMQWAGFNTLTLDEVPTIKGSAPWHIGAYKYYKEQGLEIPEHMIPPEAK
jgi:uncharacterized protein